MYDPPNPNAAVDLNKSLVDKVVLPLVSLAVISWEYQPKLLVDVVCPVTSKSNVSGVPSLAFSCQWSNPWLKKLIVIFDADRLSPIVSNISCVPVNGEGKAENETLWIFLGVEPDFSSIYLPMPGKGGPLMGQAFSSSPP